MIAQAIGTIATASKIMNIKIIILNSQKGEKTNDDGYRKKNQSISPLTNR